MKYPNGKLPFTLLFSLTIITCSCKISQETLEASADLDKQVYKGSSANDAGDLFAFNLSMVSFLYRAEIPSSKSSDDLQSDDGDDNVYGMGGLEYIAKGSKLNDASFSTKVHLDYLELPLYALYHPRSAAPGSGFFGGLGPYFAYGLGGKIKSTSPTGTDVQNSFGSNGFKRFDAGITATARYIFPNSFSVRLAYDLGLANVSNEPGGLSTKNRSISINLGYILPTPSGKKKSK